MDKPQYEPVKAKPQLLKNGCIISDNWRILLPEDDEWLNKENGRMWLSQDHIVSFAAELLVTTKPTDNGAPLPETGYIVHHWLHSIPRDTPLLFPLSMWHAHQVAIANWSRQGPALPVGIWLRTCDKLEQLSALAPSTLADLEVIAIRIPRFTDGRGFSLATLLRTRLGYQNEIRAYGDIVRDQIYYLSRVGFNAFVCPNPQQLRAGLSDFSETYQTSVTEPQPLFRRVPLWNAND